MLFHFTSVNAPDYFSRRDQSCPSDLKMSHYGATYRLAHINMCLDMKSTIRAAGPNPRGNGAEVFYSVDSESVLHSLLRDDPYVISGVWTAWSTRLLRELIEPTTRPEVCLDGSRRITAIEAPVADCDSARESLERLRDQNQLAIGAITGNDVAIAWLRVEDREQALSVFHDSGIKLAGSPSAYPMVWVL
jgi:hypothetical protein